MNQQIRFCSTSDGVSIAYSSAGTGPPIVKAANWMNHLELDWKSPVWRHVLEEFTLDQTLIRYDERGTGLSDRHATEFSLEAYVSDLESVVDSAGVDRFPLIGISQGGPVAVAYAVRHPERVSHIVLFGSFSAGWRKAKVSAEVVSKREAQATLIRESWSSRNPAIRQFWTTLCIPGCRPGEAESFNELQRASADPDVASRIFESIGDLDVTGYLEQLDVPVIVLHSRGDAVVPFEEGRRLASMIRGCRFVPLESDGHLLLSHDPAWSVFVDEVRSFLGRPAVDRKTLTYQAAPRKCRVCSRVYQDPTLNYCLDDGTALSEDTDNPTQLIS